MYDEEFYTDPTLFDRWLSCLKRYLQSVAGNVRPYVWTAAFALLGMVMLSIAASLLGVLVHHATGTQSPSWAQPPAQGVTVLVALLAAQRLFCQACGAWPAHKALPERMRRMALYLGGQPAVRSLLTGETIAVAPEPVTAGEAESGAEETFVADLRNAGVNAAIGRTLFAAGIQSQQQLMHTSDRQLVAIRGVGPATVRKLRAHFGEATG
ncbi:MAG: hypothetical protein PVJ83_06310 [Gammaproteobacteria bacterium]